MMDAPSPPRLGPAAGELDTARARYRAALPEGRLDLFDIGGLDRLGLSVRVAAFAGADGFVMDGFGYGADAAEAEVGALGEISEAAHIDRVLRRTPVTVAAHGDLVAKLGAARVVDPRDLCLPAGSDWTPETETAWIPVRRWPDGAGGLAPLEAVATGPGQWTRAVGDRPAAMLFRPITCGLGAGLDLAQALSHGVLELLQRDGNCTSFRAMDRGIAITLDRIADPGLARLVEDLEARGLEITAKLASTEFGLVNLYVVGRGLDTGAALAQTACGEAVHPNAERALRKALLEFCAARCRKAFMHGPLDPIRRLAPEGYLASYARLFDPAGEEPRALAEMTRWREMPAEALVAELADTVFAVRERVALSALQGVPDAAVRAPDDRLADVAGRLAEAGIPIWYFDASPEGPEAPSVVKAIAPGLEGETMSYHRIGARGARRLIERGVAFVDRHPHPGWQPVRMSPAGEAAAGGPAWFDPAGADAIVGGRYPLYREPSSHAVAFSLGERP